MEHTLDGQQVRILTNPIEAQARLDAVYSGLVSAGGTGSVSEVFAQLPDNLRTEIGFRHVFDSLNNLIAQRRVTMSKAAPTGAQWQETVYTIIDVQ